MTEGKLASTRVLFITNPEASQSRSMLATCYAMLTLPNDDSDALSAPPTLHVASFEPLRPYVDAISTQARTVHHAGIRADPIVFHPLAGLSMAAAYSRPRVSGDTLAKASGTGIMAKWRQLQVFFQFAQPWDGQEFMMIYRSVENVLKKVKPDVVVVDPIFTPAMTAVKRSGRRWLVLSGGTLKDAAVWSQPTMDWAWKYPHEGSGLPFPLPWYLVPINIVLIAFFMLAAYFNKSEKHLSDYIKSQTGSGDIASVSNLGPRPKGTPSAKSQNGSARNGSATAVAPLPPRKIKEESVKLIVSTIPQLDFPLRYIPPHVVPAGPMIPASLPATIADPSLGAWLAKGPTISINFGNGVFWSQPSAIQMAEALRFVLDRAHASPDPNIEMKGLQVLWRLWRDESMGKWGVNDEGCMMRTVLGKYIDADIVRVVDWVIPDPVAILREETVVCAVHHGGANSFLEASTAGVAQVICPTWSDKIDWAQRAEVLGIGKIGNRLAQPHVSAPELGPIFVEVLFSQKGREMRERAKNLAALCNAYGGGRAVAAKAILAEAAGF